ncbi:19749_t:CDS:2, partial [Gigaspora margarita]
DSEKESYLPSHCNQRRAIKDKFQMKLQVEEQKGICVEVFADHAVSLLNHKWSARGETKEPDKVRFAELLYLGID